MIQFAELLASRLKGTARKVPGRLLCLDPGHTTGWSFFEDGTCRMSGQITTVVDRQGNNEGTIHWEPLARLIEQLEPDWIICEDYRVYAHKLDRHTNSQVLTLRIIGAIDFMARHRLQIPITYQSAAAAKGFVTDAKLKGWGMWPGANKHAADSIRHGCYFLLFNKDYQWG